MKQSFHKKIVVFLLLGACSQDAIVRSSSDRLIHTSLAGQQRSMQSVPGGILCPVFENGGQSQALPTFFSLRYAERGFLSSNDIERLDLAAAVMSDGTPLQVKARYLNYVETITVNNSDAIALVQKARQREQECTNFIIEQNQRVIAEVNRRPENSPIRAAGATFTRSSYISYLRNAEQGVRQTQEISNRLYNNILMDLRNRRSSLEIPISSKRPEVAAIPTQRTAPEAVEPLTVEPRLPKSRPSDRPFERDIELLRSLRNWGVA